MNNMGQFNFLCCATVLFEKSFYRACGRHIKSRRKIRAIISVIKDIEFSKNKIKHLQTMKVEIIELISFNVYIVECL